MGASEFMQASTIGSEVSMTVAGSYVFAKTREDMVASSLSEAFVCFYSVFSLDI